ncbi:alkylglycerol monooxygenase-like [Penaeus monodon]|uniref:alkylglycerol monooxygenase-like n=1 Tax=Penaeus monodon TaxID=6687 RepID=UPI0018A6F60F|nr:alkylglycerol monooxygenase-like [Penaeus monodon]
MNLRKNLILSTILTGHLRYREPNHLDEKDIQTHGGVHVSTFAMASVIQRLGYLFYAVNPKASLFKHPEEVPRYENEVCTGKQIRSNEVLTSLAIGLLHETTVFISEGAILLGYEWLYQYRVLDLPWDSLYTWWAAFFFVDFCYYWVHRANHEVNLLWAAHQVHHSSEDYILPTAVRVSVFQRMTYFGFYHPLALLGIPISSVMVHLAFNFLFQFWVHNEDIGKLGPLEWVFNTPSHHRVHHGSNKWCLDKNYGSIFIIWDRIFGTFQEEREGEEIVYGLVDQPQSMNGVWHEIFYFEKIYEKARSMSSWSDSLKAVFYGPGWVPGAPRLGDPDGFPDVRAPRGKYDPQMPAWFLWYTLVHLTIGIFFQQIMLIHLQSTLSSHSQASSWLTVALFIAFNFLTVGVLGSMFDGWRWAPLLEAARCAAFLLYARATPISGAPMVDAALVLCFAMSAVFWTSQSLLVIGSPAKAVKFE